jgi:ATP-dependent NAD(P)H-hydrate dehydratase
VLTGCLATLIAWGSYSQQSRTSTGSRTDLASNLPYLCGYGASRLVREAGLLTYQQKGRSMITGDIIENIGITFAEIFEDLQDDME